MVSNVECRKATEGTYWLTNSSRVLPTQGMERVLETRRNSKRDRNRCRIAQPSEDECMAMTKSGSLGPLWYSLAFTGEGEDMGRRDVTQESWCVRSLASSYMLHGIHGQRLRDRTTTIKF